MTGVAPGVVAGAPGAAGEADIGDDGLIFPGGPGLNGSLLKLNANGFLQGAQRAQFFGSDQCQGAPR